MIMQYQINIRVNRTESSLSLDIFTKDQFYIIMEFPFGGIDLERFPVSAIAYYSSISFHHTKPTITCFVT